MADSILRLKVESQEYDAKLKRAAEGIQRYAENCKKAGGTLEYLDEGVLEFTRALGGMETTARGASARISELKKTFTDLSVQYNKLTEEEKQSPFGKALSESLDRLKIRIQDGSSEIKNINDSLNSSGGLRNTLDAVAGKFGLNIDQITKFGGVVGVTTTAIKVAKDAFFNMESGIDEWGRTVEGAKGAYNVFLDTLNNGNWSGFFQNLQTAIQGGRDLYDIFDRLGSIKSNNAAAIALVQQQIAQLRLAKQQGQNVDAQIKAATERLAMLQGQSVTAGKAAGTQSAFNVIRNGVNSIGGANINDATINYAIQRIMQNGQTEFDKYQRNRDILYQKGLVTRTQTIATVRAVRMSDIIRSLTLMPSLKSSKNNMRLQRLLPKEKRGFRKVYPFMLRQFKKVLPVPVKYSRAIVMPCKALVAEAENLSTSVRLHSTRIRQTL